jgi:hypothetical protein
VLQSLWEIEDSSSLLFLLKWAGVLLDINACENGFNEGWGLLGCVFVLNVSMDLGSWCVH